MVNDVIIPSKNIYNISAPKVRNNVVKGVELKTQRQKADNRFDITVASYVEDTQQLLDNLENADWVIDAVWNSSGFAGGTLYNWATAAMGVKVARKNATTVIQRQIDNSYISKIKAVNGGNLEGINITLQCKKYVGMGVINATNDANHAVTINSRTINYSDEYEIVNVMFDDGEFVIESLLPLDYVNKVVASVSIQDNTDIIPNIDISEDNITVVLENVLYSLEKFSGLYGVGADSTPRRNFDMEISAEKYEPISMEISFQGNTIGISFESETISIGDTTSKNVLSFDGNEIIQSTNAMRDYSVPYTYKREPAIVGFYERIILEGDYGTGAKLTYKLNGEVKTVWISQAIGGYSVINTYDYPFEIISVTADIPAHKTYLNVIDEYKNGKESLTLLCSLGAYFDMNGDIKVDGEGYNLFDISLVTQADGQIIKEQNRIELNIIANMTNFVPYYFLSNGKNGVMSELDGRLYATFRIDSPVEYFCFNFEMYDVEGDDDTSFVYVDISTLEPGIYTLSFGLDGYINIVDLQLNSGKLKAYRPKVKTHFEEGDIVVPMQYTANGTDAPYATLPDGSAKRFKVVGVEFIYDGAPWQKITLQEN